MCAVEVTPVVSTERLILRGPVAGDVAAIVALASDLNVAGMTTSMPHPYGATDAEGLIRRAQACDWDREALFVVEHRSFGLVGRWASTTGALVMPRSAMP